MPDKGHKMTDDLIKKLEDKLHELYAKADSDLQKKAASRLKTYNEMVKVKEKTLDDKAFKEWKKNQAYILSNQKSLVDTIADDLVKTDQIALDIINDHTPKAYALNYNYGTYQIEDAGKINTSFALYNHETVELLALYDDSSLLPEKKDLDIPKDLQWNKKHLSQAISQGVLQGESIDKIAKRLSAAVGMDENGAIRNARTMMTAAQNGGRVDAYLRGKAMGIELQQKWQATEDSRTRKSHRAIDGEVVEVGEEFSNHCHFPGDPAGPGREVYNCRCTLLPLVNGIKNFNPLSDDKYIKKGFEDWLKDQADPYITAKFGDKSLNKVYHQLLDEKGSKIGNYFYNHVLGDIGKPSQTWKDYINGTLDSVNTKKIDDYLFKHFDLNANKLDDAVKTVDKVDDISDAIKAAEADVKWTKGEPMSTADADNHKVNPLYNIDDKASKTNCQTCSFVYECRKQGYDVVALPTYKTNSFKDIYHLQVEISHDASVGWINKTTGKAPKSLYKGSPDYDTIDKLVGNSGERYIFGVKFDGANGHSINLDRDSKGNLRIIDNQRGPKEKNVWTGQKEIEEYFKNLDKVNGIEELVRVDDCVPNAKYLNAIAQDAKKIKNVDPYKNLNHFSEQLPIAEIAKKKGFDVEDYYNKWRLGLVEDKDLDDLMNIKSKAVDVTPKVSKIDLDALKDKKVKHIYDELKSEKTHNKFYNELKGIGDKDGIKQAEVWKKYLAGELNDEDTAKIEKYLVKKYAKGDIKDTTNDALEAAKKKYNVDKLDDAVEKILNDPDAFEELYQYASANLNFDAPAELAKKYLKGEVDIPELDKHLATKIDNISDSKTSDNEVFDFLKKKYGYTNADSLTDELWQHDDIWKIADKYAQEQKVPVWQYLNQYVNGKVENDELNKHLGMTKTTTKISDKDNKTLDTVKPFSIKDLSADYDSYNELMHKIDEMDKINHTNMYAEVGKTIKDLKQPYNLTFNGAYKKYINGEIKSDKLDDLLAKVFSGKYDGVTENKTFDADLVKSKAVSSFINEWKKEGNTALASQWWKTIGDIGKNYGLEKKQSKVWELYKTGKLTDDENKKIEDFLTKHYFNKSDDTVKDITKPDPKLKAAEEKLEKAKKELKDNVDMTQTWASIWKDDVTLADYEAKKSTIKAKKIYYDDELDKLKNDPSYKSWMYEEDKQSLIWKYEKLSDDLEEYEEKGEEYLKYKKAIDKAQKEVIKYSPVDAAYSQERKDAAVWAKDKGSDYKRVDKIFDPHAREVHAARTHKEYDAYIDYTGASGPFNKPLVGFDSPDGSGSSGWTEKYWVGPGDVDIDKRGRGDNIRALTTLIEKSTYDFDFWIQSSQNFETFEGFGGAGFFGIPYDTLQNMSNEELQQFVGKQNKLPQFISGAINKGGGSYNPGNVRMNIYVPKGSEALYVLEDGTFGKGEHEMILQRGGTYRVTKIYWGKDTINGGEKLIIDLELRLEEGYDKFQQNKK